MQEDHARWRLMAERREEVSAAEMAEMVEQRRRAMPSAAFGADEEDDEDVGGRSDLGMRSELHAASVLREEAHGEVMQSQAKCYGNWCV